MPDSGPEIIEASINREQGRDPQQYMADFRVFREQFIARRPRDEEAERDELQRRLPFGNAADRDRDFQIGQEFPQAGDSKSPGTG